MNISKFKVVTKYLTGGIANVIEYILDLFNEFIKKLPASEVSKYAQVAKDVAVFVQNLANTLITNEAKKKAALATAQAFEELAKALLDCTLTKDELDVIVDAVQAAIKAWKEAK